MIQTEAYPPIHQALAPRCMWGSDLIIATGLDR